MPKLRKEITVMLSQISLKQLYFRFFLLACTVLPLQVAEKVGRYVLNKISPNYEKWTLVWQITLIFAAGKMLKRSSKSFKEHTVELNKRAHSSKAKAYQTLCFIMGMIILVMVLKGGH